MLRVRRHCVVGRERDGGRRVTNNIVRSQHVSATRVQILAARHAYS